MRKPEPPGSDWKSLEAVHKLMFWVYIAALLGLNFNICGLKDATMLNKNVPNLRERISQSIPAVLQYGSLFWLTHLSGAKLAPACVRREISGLKCTERVLFWLEVMPNNWG